MQSQIIIHNNEQTIENLKTAYLALIKSIGMITKDKPLSYYQSDQADYYRTLMTDTKFFENFHSYLSIAESLHNKLSIEPLLTAMHHATLLCNKKQNEIKCIGDIASFIQEYIKDPIWNYHYALFHLENKNTSDRNIDDSSVLPDELWQHSLSFFSSRNKLAPLKCVSKKFKSLIDDPQLNLPYEPLNYHNPLLEYQTTYLSGPSINNPTCFLLISEYEFLTSQGNILYQFNTTNSIIDFWNYPVITECITMQGHTDTILTACLFQKDKVITGSKDSTIRIWDLKTQQCIQILEGHKGQINSVIVLNDTTIISASRDNTIIIWDLEKNSHEVVNINIKHPIANYAIFRLIKLNDDLIICATRNTIFQYDVKNKSFKKNVKRYGRQQDQNPCLIQSICLSLPDILLVSLEYKADDNLVQEVFLNPFTHLVYGYNALTLERTGIINHPETRARFAAKMHSLPNGIIAFTACREKWGDTYENRGLTLYDLKQNQFIGQQGLCGLYSFVSSLPDHRIVTYNGELSIFSYTTMNKNKLDNKNEKEVESVNQCRIS